MVATFDPALTNSRDRIRLIVGDTDIDAPYLHDETYDALLALNVSFEAATLSAFDAILSLLAVPDIYADWYREFNHEAAYNQLKKSREDYANANGLSRFRARAVTTYRADSNQTVGFGDG